MLSSKTIEQRAQAALIRIRTGVAPMRIPADEDDPDLVISDLVDILASERRAREEAQADLSEAQAEVERLTAELDVRTKNNFEIAQVNVELAAEVERLKANRDCPACGGKKTVAMRPRCAKCSDEWFGRDEALRGDMARASALEQRAIEGERALEAVLAEVNRNADTIQLLERRALEAEAGLARAREASSRLIAAADNMALRRGHEAGALGRHPPPCGTLDFCVVSHFLKTLDEYRAALAPPATGALAELIRGTLAEHWLAGIDCDEETKTDRARCACSLVALPATSTVGEAVAAWAEHVVARALGRTT